MTDFFTTNGNLIKDALGLSYESAAMQTAISLELNASELRAPLDLTLIRLGLESTTSIATHVSEDGVFDWVKGKLSVLGRKINIVINKLYAKLTRADEATKELIDRASTDASVELPISGVKAAAVIGSTTAVLAGITYLATNVFGITDKQKLKIINDKIASASKKCAKLREAGDHKKAAKYGDLRNKHLRESIRVQTKINDRKMEKNSQPPAKPMLLKIYNLFSAVRKAIGDFASKFRSAENTAASEAKSHDGDSKVKVSLWERLKNVGRNIANLFSIVGHWFASLPSIFKRGKKEA